MSYFSDYGTGSSSNSSSSWLPMGNPTLFQSYSAGLEEKTNGQKAASFQDLVMGRCTLEDIMKELQMNGSDTPHMLEDKIWSNNTHHTDNLIGMGPSSAYLRQKSWPEPERTPAQRLPRAASDWLPTAAEFMSSEHEFATSTPINDGPAYAPPPPAPPLTEEQLRVLNTLPNAVLFALLHELERGRAERRPRRHHECRFCKNNGERESYYRSHCLKDGAGRVTCPVLRAFVCSRCGASGDSAHTSKYCPLSTADERIKSTAMMRSVRLAAGRRRAAPPLAPDYVLFGAAPPSVAFDSNVCYSYAATAPLDPSWAALEQKLSL